jgi:hypothetical protein
VPQSAQLAPAAAERGVDPEPLTDLGCLLNDQPVQMRQQEPEKIVTIHT